MDYKPYSSEWHRKRYLKEAIDKYFDDYAENEVIHSDLMDILSARMTAAAVSYTHLTLPTILRV